MSGLEIIVKDIKGKCAVHNIGDRIVISGPEIDLKSTDKICIHALPSLLHYAVALREGTDPVTLGLATEGDSAFISCPDPGAPYTEGGTVIFEVRRTID